MENTDLKYIKKHYGEDFMHMCRSLFPTLLETEGLLSKIISSKFADTHSLYEDIKNNNLENEFKNYIFSFVDVEKEEKTERKIETPEALMKKAGYILYPECKSESEIQSFKKYYRHDEQLCTFNGGRLNSCRVWFAVKENIDEIKRKDFKTPTRQDSYGTSVISIQFSKGKNSTLSIKNRYNHTVNNPDATFSNNLDNIIAGLEESFCKTYNINLVNGNEKSFEIPSYVMANDGKFYRSNLEKNGVNYCENNIYIINNGRVTVLDKFTTLLIENYLIDLKNKNIIDRASGNLYYEDAFIQSIGEIKDIKIQKYGDGKDVIITPTKGNNVIIKINNHNEIIGYINENVKFVENEFLYYNEQLTELNLPNVENIGDDFLLHNRQLTQINLPKVEKIGNRFLYYNKELTKINLPNVKEIGDCFLYLNEELNNINLPEVKTIGNNFLYYNEQLTEINLPNVEIIGNDFLCCNKQLTELNLQNVKEIGNYFLYSNENIFKLNLPNVEIIGNNFLLHNRQLTHINLPSVKKIGDRFLYLNEELTKINLPNVEIIGNGFLYHNEQLTELNLPNVEIIGNDFLYYNEQLTEINLPNVEIIGNNFLLHNRLLTQINLPKVEKIGDWFLYYNEQLTELNLPKVKEIGNYFLFSNENIFKLNLPKVKEIGFDFLYSNENIFEINLPNVEIIGNDFLCCNELLTELNLPNVKEIGNSFLFNNTQLNQINLSELRNLEGYNFLLYNNIKYLLIPINLLKEIKNMGEREQYNRLKNAVKNYKSKLKIDKNINEENVK